MEQIISVFGINMKLLAVQMVNFAILLLILHRFLYKPLVKMMESRRLEIEKGLDDAKQAGLERADAQKVRGEIIAQSKVEAKEIVDKAISSGEKMKDGIVSEADAKAHEILVAAEKRAEEEKARVTEEAKKEVGSLAVAAVEKILREKMDPSAEKAFIGKLMA